MRKQLIFCSAFLVFSSQAAASEPQWELSVGTGGERLWMPQTTFTLDTVNQTKSTTARETNLFGGEVGIKYKLPENSFLSGDFLGSNPKISFGVGYYSGSAEATQTDSTGNPNSALTVDGTLGGSWAGGVWYAENSYRITNVDLTVLANPKDDAGSWSFAPEFGLAGRYFGQIYDLNRNASGTNIHDGDLNSYMYGGQIGFKLNSPSYKGWNLSVTPSIKFMLADTDMSVIQDKDGVIGGTYTDGLEVKDSKTSMVYEGRLSLTVGKKIDSATLGFTVFGTATSGTPYIDMPESAGDAAKISTNEMAYSMGAKIGLTLPF
jgi:hypothetical protein